jgi:hypothetical protein
MSRRPHTNTREGQGRRTKGRSPHSLWKNGIWDNSIDHTLAVVGKYSLGYFLFQGIMSKNEKNCMLLDWCLSYYFHPPPPRVSTLLSSVFALSVFALCLALCLTLCLALCLTLCLALCLTLCLALCLTLCLALSYSALLCLLPCSLSCSALLCLALPCPALPLALPCSVELCRALPCSVELCRAMSCYVLLCRSCTF